MKGREKKCAICGQWQPRLIKVALNPANKKFKSRKKLMCETCRVDYLERRHNFVLKGRNEGRSRERERLKIPPSFEEDVE